jgi:hypothetical protein
MKLFVFSLLATSSFIQAQEEVIAKSFSNRILFFEGYERIQKDYLYAAILGWISYDYLSSGDCWLVQGEARIGYSFNFERTSLIPFLGGGYLDDFKISHDHERRYLKPIKEQSLEYAFGSYGLLINHSFNPLFDLGLNLKGMIGIGTIGSKKHSNRWAFGLDVGLPFGFNFGYQRRFDIRFEPFFIFLKSKYDESNYLGQRLFVGYKF